VLDTERDCHEEDDVGWCQIVDFAVQDEHFGKHGEVGPGEYGIFFADAIAQQKIEAGQPNGRGQGMREQGLLPDVVPRGYGGIFAADDCVEEGNGWPVIAELPK
jgi:hypothetical protein